MKRHALVFAVPALLALLAPRAARAEQPAADARGVTSSEKPALRGFASGGASVAGLFGLTTTAVHARGGLGIETKGLFVPLGLEADVGRTEAGLGAGQIMLDGGVQAILGPVRLGGGLAAGYAWFARASTSSLPYIGAYALDGFLLATVDLLEIGGRRALYIGVRPSAGVRWGESIFAVDHGTVGWGGAAAIGVRF